MYFACMLKHKSLYWILFIALGFNSCTKDYTSGQLPMVYLDVDGQIRPDDKIDGEFSIEVDNRTVVSGDMGVEYRGSTSYRLSDKKSYGFEIRKANGSGTPKALLGMPAESDWILMGHVVRSSGPDDLYAFDPTLMHHYVGYELARSIGMYAARCRWVELTVNGQYQGVYVLMEKLKADRMRIDVGEPYGLKEPGISGGYILKIDKTASYAPSGRELSYYDNNWGDDANYTPYISFRSEYDIEGSTMDIEPFRPPYHDDQYRETYFLHEFPKPNELNGEMRSYISDYIYDFESAIILDNLNGTSTVSEYIDMETFADGFIMNELAGNIDAYRISTFLHKPRGGKLRFGPIWDLNIGYGRQGRVPWTDWIANYNDYVSQDAWMVPFWWDMFLESAEFKSTVKSRWTQYRNGPLSDAAIFGLVNDTEGRLLSTGAAQRNYDLWRAENRTINFEGEVDFLRNYLEQRLAWMDDEIGSW